MLRSGWHHCHDNNKDKEKKKRMGLCAVLWCSSTQKMCKKSGRKLETSKSLFHPISSLHSYSKSGFNIGCQFVGPLDVHTWISVPRQHLAWNAFTSKGALDVATNTSDMCSKISERFQLTVDSYADLCHWTEETWQQDVPIMLRLPVVEKLPCLWLVPHVRDLRGVGEFFGFNWQCFTVVGEMCVPSNS